MATDPTWGAAIAAMRKIAQDPGLRALAAAYRPAPPNEPDQSLTLTAALRLWPTAAELYLDDDDDPRAEIKIEPKDAWVGAYIDRADKTVYVCPLPCLVIKVRWGR